MDHLTYPPTTRAGLTAVLQAGWPAAYRLAAGLTGRPASAGAVAARVLDRAAVAATRWATPEQADRWFTRYTVLTARGVMDHAGGDHGLAWLAPLTPQQREAVVLHHGLGLDLNRMAAAMDCSSRAASTHLVAAITRLRGTGPLGEWTAALPAQLAAVVPPAADISADVVRVVGRRRRLAVARRTLGWAVTAAVFGLLAWAVWHVWPMVVT